VVSPVHPNCLKKLFKRVVRSALEPALDRRTEFVSLEGLVGVRELVVYFHNKEGILRFTDPFYC
jgi:hypothetical protein